MDETEQEVVSAPETISSDIGDNQFASLEAQDEEEEDDEKLTSKSTPKKKKHDKEKQLALARASAARKRAAKERGEVTREPAAKGLILPYRAVRRIMKLDKQNSTIQIEAAIVATKAAELFVQKMAKESHKHAKERGRNGIKYEDIAESRALNENLSFLDILLP